MYPIDQPDNRSCRLFYITDEMRSIVLSEAVKWDQKNYLHVITLQIKETGPDVDAEKISTYSCLVHRMQEKIDRQ
jgi:hypothetical protein